MKKTRQIVWGLALAALISTTVFAHMKVAKTAPEDGAALDEAPESVQIWYTQEPDAAVSKVTLTGPEGEVKLLVHPGGDKSLMGMVQGTNVGAGEYVVAWQTAGDDGHIQKGEYKFTVKASH